MAKKLSFVNHPQSSSANPSSSSTRDNSTMLDAKQKKKKSSLLACSTLGGCSPKGRFLSEVTVLWILFCVPINALSFYLLATLPEYIHQEANATESANSSGFNGTKLDVTPSEFDIKTDEEDGEKSNLIQTGKICPMILNRFLF